MAADDVSRVTNAILAYSIMDEDDVSLADVNAFFAGASGFVSCDFEDEQGGETCWYGGSKMLETPLAIGAFNHLDLDGLIAHLRTLPWTEPENVQLIIKGQEDSRFHCLGIVP